MTIREPQCMTWKRCGAEHVRRQVESMSREEELGFWRKRTEKMQARQEARRSGSRQSDTQEESAGTRRFTESNSCWIDSDIAIREPECVAIKRRGQEHVRRLIEGMTIDEELEFWRKRTEETRARQKANRPESERSDSASRPTWPFSYPPPVRRLSATTKTPSATTAPKPWSSPTSKPSPPATPPPTWPCRLARPGDNSP